MLQMLRVVIATVFAFAFIALPVAAQGKRVALVIGNSAYQHTSTLTNPKNDATDIVAALRKHGFHVLEGYDLDKAALDRKVRDFADALRGSEVGLFFYAGHGLQVGGYNYLVPIDAQLSTVSALDFEMVRLDLVHRTMEREAQTNFIFLDACRDNPLARNLARAMGTRSTEIERGLAAVESGVGTLISFSTQPGNVALDGSGRNSPFAGALAKHMMAATDDLSAILIAVRNDVMRETQRRQVPWEHSALTGRFYFADPPPPQQSPPGEIFTLRDSELVRAFAAKHQFLLPPFAVEKPDDGLADEGRRFLGVWGSEEPFDDGSQRRWMLIVSRVDRSLKVAGVHAVSADVRGGSDKVPAGYARFVGEIKGATLSFDGGWGSQASVTYSSTDRLSVVIKRADGKQDKLTAQRIRAGVKVELPAEGMPAAKHAKSYWLQGVWRGVVIGLNDKKRGDVRTLTVDSVDPNGSVSVIWSSRADGAGFADARMNIEGDTIKIVTRFKSIVTLSKTDADHIQGTFQTKDGRVLSLTMKRL